MATRLKKTSTVLLIWTVAGLLYSAQSYYYRLELGRPVKWLPTLAVDAPYFILWALFTPIALLVSRRFQFTRENWGRLLLPHFTLALLVPLGHAVLYNLYRFILTAGVENGVDLRRIFLNAAGNVDYGILVYFVLLLVINVLDYYGRFQKERTQNAELETALVQSQLNALKMQLQPHFLFNTLNSIAVLIKDNPERAAETVSHLSELLRHVLKNVDDQFTNLKQEVDFIRQYLAIEQVRFGDRLKIRFDIPTVLDQTPVPSLILQPLVENAIRHGIAGKIGPGLIALTASKSDKKLCLEVYDNGRGYETETSKGQFGLGLKITRERLHSLYGENFEMNFSQAQEGGTRLVLQIPIPQETLQ